MSTNFNTTAVLGLPENAGGTRVLVSGSSPMPIVDNIFIVNDGPNIFRIQPYAIGTYHPSWVLSTSGNKLSYLQDMVDHPDIDRLVIDKIFSLTGTLTVPVGKILKFVGNGRLTGTCTIIGATIEAGLNQHIFGLSVTLEDCFVNGSESSVRWFGAVGSGDVNDQPSIQKAMDTAISNTTFPRDLKLPVYGGGNYRIDSPLIAYNWNGSNYQFFTLNLIGEASTQFTTADFSTRITCTFSDTFAIGYQRARSSVIKGLWIQGTFTPSFANIREMCLTPYADFMAGSGCRDNRYSPYSGILIDPFMNWDDPDQEYIPFADRYPGLASWYRGSGTRGGSSAVRVQECRILKFTVGLGYSVNGMTLNAEDCPAEDLSIDTVKCCYAYGQAQIKDNYIRNGIHWEYIGCVVDCNTYGSTSGLRPSSPYIDGLNIAGGVVNLFNMTSPFVGCAQNIFAELLFRLGTLDNAAPFTLQDCEFNFMDDGQEVFPDFHLFGNNLIFDSCKFRVFDDQFNKRMILRGTNITFNNCRFDQSPTFKSQSVIEFNNCRTGNDVYIGVKNLETNTSNGISVVLGGGAPCCYYSEQIGSVSPLYTQLRKFYFDYPKAYKIQIALPNVYVPITVNTGNATATINFGGSGAYNITVGDWLIEAENTLVSYFFLDSGEKNPFPVYGRVSAVNYSTGVVSLEYVPLDITNQAQCYPGVFLDVSYDIPICGNVTSGSAVVTRAIYPPGLANLSIGQRFGTNNVVSVDTEAHTVTFRIPFDFTCDDFMITNAGCIPEYVNNGSTPLIGDSADVFTRPFLKGTRWVMPETFVFENEPVSRVFVCLRSGYLNATGIGESGTLQSVWRMDAITRQNSDSFEFWDFNANAWVEVGTGVGSGLPNGGTTGQALLKASNTDGDASWSTLTASAISDFQIQVSANTDVATMKTIIGDGISDGDSVVDTLSEMLSVFQTYAEGVDIATQLAGKQTSDSDLAAIAALSPANDDFIQRKSGVWTNRGPAQVKVDLAIDNLNNTADLSKPISTATQTALDGKENKLSVGILQTSNYILVLADANRVVRMNMAGANTVTVPPNADIFFPVATQIIITQIGAGQTTITPGSGVTFQSADGATKLRAQYSSCSLIKLETNTWSLAGDLEV